MTPKIVEPAELRAWLKDHPAWRLGGDGELHADFCFKNFKQAVMFTNAVAYLAETAKHHPDIYIHDYKSVTLSLMTHSVGAITQQDLDLVLQIDELPRYA